MRRRTRALTMATPWSTTMSERLSRYSRAEHPPRMQLTARDRAILCLVWDYRYLTRAQIQKLVFPTPADGKEQSRKNIVTRRLMLLYQHGYLDRLHPPIASVSGSSPIVYCLDRKGARLLAAELELEVKELGWQKRQRDRALLFLQHTLAVNDFRITVELAAQAGGHQIISWLDERSLTAHAAREGLREIGLGMGKGGSVLPDACFALQVGSKKARFFLEIDRGHTEGPRIRRKVRIYREYYASGLYERHFGSRSLRVLTVTTTDRRLGNLRKWSESEGGGRLFWFTTQRLVFWHALLEKPIWSVAGTEGLYPLL
jgi:hypothetical protein